MNNPNYMITFVVMLFVTTLGLTSNLLIQVFTSELAPAGMQFTTLGGDVLNFLQ